MAHTAIERIWGNALQPDLVCFKCVVVVAVFVVVVVFYILYDLIRVVRVRGRGPDDGHDGNPLGGLLRGAGDGTARHRDNTYFGPRH